MEAIDISQLTEIFLRWQFLAAAIAISVVVEGVKRSIKIAYPALFKSTKFQGLVLTNLNLVLGALIGLIPGFLLPEGGKLTGGIIIGLVAGTFSNHIYSMVKKRTFETESKG